MTRPLRLSFENAFYHITSRGNRREKIFYSDRDKEVFLKRLKEMLIKYSTICYAYCLMDNHYHIFIKTNKSNLSQGIHYLNSSYANWFRNKHQIIGPLFQGRFKSILVDADNYALVLSAYIHLNPLRAGIIKQLEDYPWSSYLDYLNLRKSDMTDPSFVLKSIDQDTFKAMNKYREYVSESQNMKDPIKESYHHIALGSATFIERVKEKIEHLGRRREIPSTRFQSKHDVDTIITKMTQALPIERKRIFDKKRGNLNRSLAIYLVKRFTPLSLSEIGELFKMDYSAVSQAAKRFEQKSEVNHEIK
ncbi:MAG TPA: chromosomal replication initiator DnaA, partial [Candidatus Atribacteria bacterium]|nr:chromosomal replication initiator DnaA [Candidatus Atribacteria bacterium]